MSRFLILPAAVSLFAFALPAGATPTPGSGVQAGSGAQAPAQAEQEADRAVAEARAEVLAEARGDAAQASEAGALTAVTVSDVREGSLVRDTQGGQVGTIESVDENGAIVSTGRARAKLPFSSFGRNGRGLVISMTRAELEAEVASRTAS